MKPFYYLRVSEDEYFVWTEEMSLEGLRDSMTFMMFNRFNAVARSHPRLIKLVDWSVPR